MDETHFLELDKDAEILQGFGKPSAETLLHLSIYRFVPKAYSILHTHSVWGTILSDRFFERGAIEIEGYEMLKGLSGVKTHEHKRSCPWLKIRRIMSLFRTSLRLFCAKTGRFTGYIYAATDFIRGTKVSLKRGGMLKFSSFCLRC